MAKNANVKAVLSNSLPLIKVTFGSEIVKEPGQYLTRQIAASTPSIAHNTSSGTYTGAYVMLNVDLDAPFPSFAFLAPIMHWLQSDLTLSSTKDEGGFATLSAPEDSKVSVDWAGPGPPPGSAPHRYVFMLYEQPEGFDSEKLGLVEGAGIRARMRFDLDGFEKKAGLGKAVAGNWFVSN